ncbi:MAG: iron-containing redox enzyme family protein [Candidatus Acidiferrales bacterium]|jgi:hypothetical protein
MAEQALSVDHKEAVAKRIVAALDQRIDCIVKEFRLSPIGHLVETPDSPIGLIVATMREIYWEIHCYQPFTTKAGFAMIGATNAEDGKVMRTLLLHKWEEVEHRVWALEGYKALGGDQSRIGKEAEFFSPGAFAVAAVWEHLAQRVHPLAYLGAEYLFEDLTARLSKLITANLSKRGISRQGMCFVVDHATEDEKNSQLLRRLIEEVGHRHPDLMPQVLFAFDCFHQVYPMPLWLGSYTRAEGSQ